VMTVFAFAYDDVFSIVKRPYATREPMSSEDEQIWQKNEEKIIEFVREFVANESGDFSRKSALVRDMLRVRSKEKR